jgi:hypothetical protein
MKSPPFPASRQERRRWADAAGLTRRAKIASSARRLWWKRAQTSISERFTAGPRFWLRRRTGIMFKLAEYFLEHGANPNLRQQRRLDAALSGHRQSQHRRRRLSGARAGHGSSGFHQAADRQRRERERAYLRRGIEARGMLRATAPRREPTSPCSGCSKTAQHRFCARRNRAMSS